ncbi:MAG: oxygen-independent coproporphyrinogen III oxidase, partial [Gammaproteobacteria bacterium]
MVKTLHFDKELIARYDRLGPRYTSYPTAVQFHDGFKSEQYVENAHLSNEYPIPNPLSLYLHLPFCRNVCFYCACHRIITKNSTHLVSYLEHLKREIAMQARLFDQDRTVKQLHWGGGTPTYLSHGQMQNLMQEIRRHFNLEPDETGEYSIEIDPRETEEMTIPLLRSIGFNRISVGAQDFDPDVQKAVNRIQSVEQTAGVIASARDKGFRSVSMDLIYGLPLQSVASFNETLQTVIAMSPDRISVFNYAHMPQRFKMQRRIREQDLPAPEEKLEMLGDIIETLIGAGYVYIGMDHFAKPDDELALAQQNGTLCRNFQGYSTHGDCDLIGMGMTAISSISDCYAQNVCDIGEYQKMIWSVRYPVFRGIRLDRDDLVRRDVIMRFICDFKIDFETIEDRHGLDFREYFYNELELLKGMEDDGLLTVDLTGIR